MYTDLNYEVNEKVIEYLEINFIFYHFDIMDKNYNIYNTLYLLNKL